MAYPKRLGAFRKWAKAMEEGAVMDRPEYTKTRGKSRSPGNGRGRANTHPRRMRRKKRKRSD